MRAYAFRAIGSQSIHTLGEKMHKVVKTLAVLGFAVVAVNSWAANASIEGVVRDASGKPVSGVDVKIWPRYVGTWTKYVKTGANGHYSYDGVEPGTVYVVTLVIDSKVEWSYSSITPKSGSPTQVNFDLKRTIAPAPGTQGTKQVAARRGSGSPN